ncbi:uncharacterized protein LOC129608960 [Condylostylus longicornis]|uniref:uncharacterized protein LOC129608960 n=1 Tax=Condylostylus longicornis TaxID=2530218 RepID=UPI00244E50D2|nr:uncharacterized protein LOC129608960 [Condylostylus longicornis]
MAIMRSCCFWKTVRSGSYACAIYTLLYFGMSCLIASSNLIEEKRYLKGETNKPTTETFIENGTISPTTVIFNILLLICSSSGCLASILLIIGLRKDIRCFLIPWILVLLSDLFLELAHFIFLIVIETMEFKPVLATIFTIDFFIMCLNIYCLLCVISQYQEYKCGRGYRKKQSKLLEINDTYILPQASANGDCLSNINKRKESISPKNSKHTNFPIIPEEPSQATDQNYDEEGFITICNSKPNKDDEQINVIICSPTTSSSKKQVQFRGLIIDSCKNFTFGLGLGLGRGSHPRPLKPVVISMSPTSREPSRVIYKSV